MANDAGPDALAIELDYRLEDAVLYHELALKMLGRSQYLDLLNVPRAPEPSRLGNLPSWVPDWSAADFATSLCMLGLSGTSVLDFQATPKDLQKSLQISMDRMAIGLAGPLVDRVLEVGEVHSYQVDGRMTMAQRLARIPGEQAVFNGWEKIAQARSDDQYPATGEDLLDVYWQILTAGQTPNGYEATKEEFRRWDRTARALFRNMSASSRIRGWLNILAEVPKFIAEVKSAVEDGESIDKIMRFRERMTIATHCRLFKTETRYLGLGPRLLRKGDEIALFKGGMVPLVLRTKGEMKWELVGDAYVHGMMHGAIFEEDRCGTIWIV